MEETSRSPVVGWIPITESAINPEAEYQKLEFFVQNLLKNGVAKLSSPASFLGKELFLVYRKGENRIHHKTTVSRKEFLAHNKFNWGFTQVNSLTLLMVDPTDANHCIPLGHRDYRIAKFDDGNMVANGHFRVRASYLDTPTSLEARMAKAVKEADESGSQDAITVEKSVWRENRV